MRKISKAIKNQQPNKNILGVKNKAKSKHLENHFIPQAWKKLFNETKILSYIYEV